MLKDSDVVEGNACGTEGLVDVGQGFSGLQWAFAGNEVVANNVAVQLITGSKTEDVLYPFRQGYLAFAAKGGHAVHGAMIA